MDITHFELCPNQVVAVSDVHKLVYITDFFTILLRAFNLFDSALFLVSTAFYSYICHVYTTAHMNSYLLNFIRILHILDGCTYEL